MMRITHNKGFQMTFENGLTISCQMGANNYCSNREFNKGYAFEMSQSVTACENCEVAIWDNENRWLTREIFAKFGIGSTGDDAVAGWVDTMTVAKLIGFVSTM